MAVHISENLVTLDSFNISRITKKITTGAVFALALLGAQSAAAATLFNENFNSYSGGGAISPQFQSGQHLEALGNVAGWTKQGGNAVHVVDRANLFGNANPAPRDYAVMIWQDTLTLQNSISGANVAGATYSIDFEASAAVYAAGSQATTATEQFYVEILRANGSVLNSYTVTPGAWAGAMAFSDVSFQYTGDGSGDIRLRFGPSASDSQFNGAVDNLSISVSEVPLPAGGLLLLSGLAGVAGLKRRKKRTA